MRKGEKERQMGKEFKREKEVDKKAR